MYCTDRRTDHVFVAKPPISYAVGAAHRRVTEATAHHGAQRRTSQLRHLPVEERRWAGGNLLQTRIPSLHRTPFRGRDRVEREVHLRTLSVPETLIPAVLVTTVTGRALCRSAACALPAVAWLARVACCGCGEPSVQNR